MKNLLKMYCFYLKVFKKTLKHTFYNCRPLKTTNCKKFFYRWSQRVFHGFLNIVVMILLSKVDFYRKCVLTTFFPIFYFFLIPTFLRIILGGKHDGAIRFLRKTHFRGHPSQKGSKMVIFRVFLTEKIFPSFIF